MNTFVEPHFVLIIAAFVHCNFHICYVYVMFDIDMFSLPPFLGGLSFMFRVIVLLMEGSSLRSFADSSRFSYKI